jgi:hypothetical protein
MKSHVTLLLSIILPLAHSLSTALGADVIPTVVQSLNGPDWRLATDSKSAPINLDLGTVGPYVRVV